MTNNTALVSVVIPTFDRPQYLQRAIESALLAAPNGDVEIVVVPNGPAKSWQKVAPKWEGDDRVRWLPIALANVSAARNAGMAAATGKYIRFLDDDDYLLPGAASQAAHMERTGTDICTGLVACVDRDGSRLGRVSCPTTEDFVCAAATLSNVSLSTGNLFRRAAVGNFSWDLALTQLEDYAWIIDLACAREWKWVHFNEEVVIWFQHSASRVSSTGRLTTRGNAITDRLFKLHLALATQSRGSKIRDRAISDALWYYVHRGFPNHPFYWTRIAQRARSISSNSGPTHSLFRRPPFASMSPLVIEWVLLPARAVSQGYRKIAEALGHVEYRRRL